MISFDTAINAKEITIRMKLTNCDCIGHEIQKCHAAIKVLCKQKDLHCITDEVLRESIQAKTEAELGKAESRLEALVEMEE